MGYKTKKGKGRFLKNRSLQHILFWCLSYLILINILKVSAEIQKIDLIYTAIFHIPVLLVVYLNLQVSFSLFFEKRRYVFYLFSVLTIILLGVGFYFLLFNHWIDHIFPGYYFIAYYSFWDISLFFVIYLSASGLLHLARSWFQVQELKQEKTSAELKALKSQLNPHFLFNSLNSIYSLARKNSHLVPEKIVQLSDLMRHIIYESDVEFIPLKKEAEMIKNYIELQNLRTSEPETIKMEIAGDVRGKRIAPLLFLPFVENSFKHGLKGGTNNSYVRIKIETTARYLLFNIENSKGKNYEVADSKYKGIGIENVKKRLELIYPGKHSLVISDNENRFEVNLQIQMN
jgi:two-component system, LytTR family, sensor kinase